jgi:hypothetical protein
LYPKYSYESTKFILPTATYALLVITLFVLFVYPLIVRLFYIPPEAEEVTEDSQVETPNDATPAAMPSEETSASESEPEALISTAHLG